MKFILLTAFALTLIREQYPGQYDNVDPAVRQWFLAQQIPSGPHKGLSCCTMADGEVVEEDIRDGHYWIRWERHPEWMQVPEEAVLKEPNRHGRPVVWWYVEHTDLKIRCYAPGPLL